MVCAILDEVGVWRSDTSTAPDIETYTALTPALARVPNSILIGISTPYRGKDRWLSSRSVFGQSEQPCAGPCAVRPLSIRACRRSLSTPTWRGSGMRGPAEWLAEWRSDLSDFIGRDLLDAAKDPGVTVHPPRRDVQYVAFCDAGGGRGSAFTAAVASADGNAVTLDALFERRAPFNPTEVVAEVADLLHRYSVVSAVGDRYAAEWVTEAFASVGIRYQNSEQDRSAIYLSALPLFTAGRARLLDNARLTYQFASLERRVTKFGRDRIGPQSDGADDLCNSAAGALVLASSAAKPSLIRAAHLLVERVSMPLQIGARHLMPWSGWTVMVLPRPLTGPRDRACIPRLRLVDFAVAQLGPDVVLGAYTAANRYARECNMRYGGRLYVPPVLAEQYTHLGVDAVPRSWLLDTNALRLAVGTETAAGRVKLSLCAAEKARGTAFAGSLEGWMKQPDALAMSFMLGVVLAMGLPEPR